MKKQEISLLLLIATAILFLISYAADFSTYDTIGSARKSPMKLVHLIAKVDRSEKIIYDPLTDPNFLSFYAIDSLGEKTRVVYKNSMPADLEKSERVVLKGYMKDNVFQCSDIMLKCPSKYKEKPAVSSEPQSFTMLTGQK